MENKMEDKVVNNLLSFRFMSKVKLFTEERKRYGEEVALQNEKIRFLGQAFYFFDSCMNQGMEMNQAIDETRKRYFIDVSLHGDEYQKAIEQNYFSDYYEWNLENVSDNREETETDTTTDSTIETEKTDAEFMEDF